MARSFDHARSASRTAPPENAELVQRYGDRLLCVRYRYYPQRGRRYKTVELIVEEAPWQPQRNPAAWVWLRVAYGEEAVRERVKEAGGRWDAQRKLWRLPYRDVMSLRLEGRIVEE